MAGSQILKGVNKSNNDDSWMSSSSVMGQRYNERLIEDEEKKIVVERYGKKFNEGDIRKLRSGAILSEDGLNFFVKYLEEKEKF